MVMDDNVWGLLSSPEGQGLLTAVATGLAGARRGRPLNSLGAAGAGGLLAYNQAQQNQAEAAKDMQRSKFFDMQIQQMQEQQAQQKAAQEALQRRQGYLGSVGQVTSPRVDAQPNQFDPMAWIRMGGSPEEAKILAGAKDWGKPKVARTIESTDSQGNPVTLQYDEYGNPVGSVLSKYVAPVQVNQGNKISFVTPRNGVSLGVGMSPEGAAANARGWAGLNLEKQKFGYQQNKDAQERQDKLSGGIASNATEDERKAAGWLAQADNAWKNMQAVAFKRDKNGAVLVSPSGRPIMSEDATPGVIESLPKMPAGLANMSRSAGRQKFVQAGSSLSEALLRAATGAGVNKDEAAQKIAELTPQWGDSEEVIQQKMDAIPMYMESLKTRSGRALPSQFRSQPTQNQSGPVFLGFEGQ